MSEKQLEVLILLAREKGEKSNKELVELLFGQLKRGVQEKPVMKVMSALCHGKKDPASFVAEEGVLDTLVALFSSEDKIEEAAQLVASLCYKNKDNKDLMAKSKMMQTLCRVAKQGHMGEQTLRAISNNTQNVESLRTFLAEGMVQVLCAGVTSETQSLIVDILNNVSAMPDISVPDRECMIKLLMTQIKENLRDASVVNKVLSILNNLLKGSNKEVTGSVVAFGGVALMQSVLKAHDNKRSIVKKALRILRQVSRQVENVP